MYSRIKSEALRYLGYGDNAPDERTKALLDKAAAELSEHAAPKYCHRIVDTAEAEALLLGEDIKAHVSGCGRVILFAATLGATADALIRRAEVSDMAYALILDAAASALIEQVCDEAEAAIKSADTLKGCGFTWRYSPGYGDYPITAQREFIRFLQADKLIGLTATENSVLLPRKSVTAVIGVWDDMSEAPENNENKRGCESCRLKDTCRFRKENKSCGRN